VSRVFPLADDVEQAIHAAAGALRAGELVVVPTDTVYGLAADAFIASATARVFEVKQRPRALPLPVLVSRAKQAWALVASVPPGAEVLAEEFWPGALTMVLPQGSGLVWDLGESDGTIALRMPDHQHLLTLLETTGPLAVTSANISGEATPSTVEEIRGRLGDAVGVYLDDGPARAASGSTIVDLTSPTPRIIREGPISADAVRRALASV
jgi:tRNA threonylcarbamoyl adenosine modification protein (Sua5/YciO/YrdC/YwlC family)